MKGDFTRSTFDSRKHYSSVRMQQGRVQLDADWNEQMDIVGHRIETEAVDVIGRCGFPKHNPGFEITKLTGDLLIGPGRAYVDGILCELEAGPEVTFKTQPHLPEAQELLQGPGVYFAYLDVWRRHVTAIEDPAIRETALGGPDTATRAQTVWQVKLIRKGDKDTDLTCESELGLAPPTGKLRARAQTADDPKNPCIVPASSGYTRLENQLYRVEVHKGGTLSSPPVSDGPTFKWSRDNGSIATEWLSQDPLDKNKLTVQSTGRDSVLRFEKSGWLELTNDARELRGEPGEMRQIGEIEGDVIKILPVPGPVDINAFPPIRKARRWDSEALPIKQATGNGGYLALESGIEILFEPGTYRTGDYWLIPARAFIGELPGKIEWPMDGTTPRPLLPHGIDHHYCKLGIVEFDGKETFEVLSDCRDIFPPLTELEGGCCDVVVHPGESIQAALDSLPEAGGAVCLKAGIHEITEAIRIERSHVSLCGCPGARVIRRDDVFVVSVSNPEGDSLKRVTVEGVQFEVEGGEARDVPGVPFLAPALITVEDCEDFALRHCTLLVAGLPDQPQVPVAVAAGVVASNAARLQIQGNEMRRVTLGVVALHSSQVEVSGNTLAGPVEFIPGFRFGFFPGGEIGIWIDNFFGAWHRIERNLITNYWNGVQIGTDGLEGEGSIIAGNMILRFASGETGTGEARFAIDVTADRCVVRDNRINLTSSLCGGIQVAGLEARIEDNQLESIGEVPSIGIRLGHPDAEADLSSDSGVIRGNRLTGPQFAIWVERSPGVEVIDNTMEGSIDPPSMGILLNQADEARVTGNRITHADFGVYLSSARDCRLLDNSILDGNTGLFILNAAAVEVSRNRIERMKTAGLTALRLSGTATFTGNRFALCAHGAEPMGFALGIFFALTEVRIDGCEIVDTGVEPDLKTFAPLAYGILGFYVSECRIHGNLVSYSSLGAMPDPKAEHRAILMQGWLEYNLTDKFRLGGSALVTDNKLQGPGRSALVELPEMPIIKDRIYLRFSRVTFSNNDCIHANGGPDTAAAGTPSAIPPATVSLTGSRKIVIGNHIHSFPFIPPVNLNGSSGVFLGNSADQDAIGFSGVPNPQQDFNIL